MSDRKFHIACFILIFATLWSCKKENFIPEEEKTPEETSVVTPDDVTIIFKTRVPSNELHPALRNPPPDVSHLYYMENFDLKHVIPNDKKHNDTIRISTGREDLLVDLTYYQMDLFSYLLRAGDTLEVQYTKGFPQAEVKNRVYPTYEFCYDSLRKSQLNRMQVESEEIFSFKPKEAIGFLENDLKNVLHQEHKFLDSLYKAGGISNDYYNIQKEKIRYNYLNYFTSFYITNNLEKVEMPILQEDLNKDNLLDYTFYYKFLFNYVYNVLNDNKGYKSKNGFTNDSPSAFESVLQDSLLTNQKVKEALLTKTLIDINSNFSTSEFKKYMEIYEKEINDSSLVIRMNETFLLDLDLFKNKSDSVFLITNNNQRSTLEELISNSTQKVIYVDFWASWCVPCRRAMPESKKLEKKYSDKVKFLYVSIDKNFDDWQNASVKENLNPSNSFLALNYPDAQFYKDLNLRSIPRYLLFANGELIHKNAPGPGSENINELIEEYILENL